MTPNNNKKTSGILSLGVDMKDSAKEKEIVA